MNPLPPRSRSEKRESRQIHVVISFSRLFEIPAVNIDNAASGASGKAGEKVHAIVINYTKIAKELFLSINTVEWYVKSIYGKLRVNSH